MKHYKVRMNCSSFCDIVVVASNEDQAREYAEQVANCPQNGMEFGEFLEVEDSDIVV